MPGSNLRTGWRVRRAVRRDRAGASAGRRAGRRRSRADSRARRSMCFSCESSACRGIPSSRWARSPRAACRSSATTSSAILAFRPRLIEQVAVRERLELERRDRLYRGDAAAAERPRSHRHPRRRRAGDRLDDGGGDSGAAAAGAGADRRGRARWRARNLRPTCGRIADEVVCLRCRSRSTRSVSGTRIFRRPPTKK